jgi:hypothetical protein
MTFGPLEIIAAFVVLFAVIKLLIFTISPDRWLDIAARIYRVPGITSAVAAVLAVIVLYFLIISGVTIVEILAVWAFLALLMIPGFARYAPEIIRWARGRSRSEWLQEQWFLMAIWIGLLAWTAIEIVRI